MCRGRIQWWQSRTVSAAPVVGWTSSAGEGSTTSAGLSHNGVYVNVPLQVLGDGGAQEPEWLHCSHRAVHDGEWGESRGVSPEVHDHLHCFERVKLQVVKTAPDSQLLNLLSVGRLVTVLNEADQCGVVSKLQELDRGVFRCAVIRVEGEEQWGENAALRSASKSVNGDVTLWFVLSQEVCWISWRVTWGKCCGCLSLWIWPLRYFHTDIIW